MTFYNDNEPFVCQWTRNLMAAGHISKGTVDERAIEELNGSDLAGYERVHLFSGIAGWEAALNLAGWVGSVWSCSCPCQSFSCAGKSSGFAEARGNLWFEVLRLVRECRPGVIIGEQVPASIRHGWLDRVFTDLEKENYTCGACILGAHSVGAPHRRQRIYWVAIAQGSESAHGAEHSRRRRNGFTNGSSDDRMANSELRTAERQRLDVARKAGEVEGGTQERERIRNDAWPSSDINGLAHAERGGREQGHRNEPPRTLAPELGLSGEEVGGVDNATGNGTGCANATEPGGNGTHDGLLGASGVGVAQGDANDTRPQGRRINAGEYADKRSAWAASQFIQCADGKARRIPLEPAFQPLVANGRDTGNRVGILRSSGNGLTVPLAAEFVRAVMECLA